LDRLAALAELLEAIFPKLELGLTGMSRHRVDSPAICIAKVQQRKKPTTQIRDMTPKSKTQLCTLTVQKGPNHGVGSEPVQDTELQVAGQPFPNAGYRLAKRSRSAAERVFSSG
jgi:hypothetical protein